MYLRPPPRATFMQLRTFEAVARLGGVTRAAEALHLAQPTVSTQMKELAAAVGCELLQPAGRGVRLTDEGALLLGAVTDMFDGWKAFEDAVAETRGLLRGTLRIAGVSTTEYFLAQWLKPFAEAHPEVEVRLAIENRDAVVRRLERGEDDLAVMMMPPRHLALESRSVMANPLVAIGPAGHAWARPGARAQPLARLLEGGLLLREPGSGTRQATLDFCAERDLPVVQRMALGSNEAVKHAVAAGLGLAVLSRHALATDPAREGLAVLKVVGLPIRRQWQLVWPKSRRLARSAAVFMDSVTRGVAAAVSGAASARDAVRHTRHP